MVNAPPGIATALDIFVGYVLLDAWIANQDRHHENWGALRDDELRLAPTFDHAASLARNITDQERKERMTTKDKSRTVAGIDAKARSAFHAEATAPKPLGTVEAFATFTHYAAPAARIWLSCLATVGQSAVQRILREVPDKRMTSIAKEFTLKLLMVNQARLGKVKV